VTDFFTTSLLSWLQVVLQHSINSFLTSASFNYTHDLLLLCFYTAAALIAMHSTILPTAIPSVRLSHAGTLSRRRKLGSRGLH